MGLRERIAAEAARAQAKVRDEMAERVVGPDGSASIEGFLLGLVRTARGDDDEDESTEKEVRRAARKRRRRLGLASFAAGPFAGVAGEVTDLYSETATVCDLVDLHDLVLSDGEIAAHMLVLWCVTEDLAVARAAVDGTGLPIAALVTIRLHGERMAEATSVAGAIKLIWSLRDVTGDVRDSMSGGAFKRVFRAGSQTKDFVARAEHQLGIGASS